MSDEDLTFIEKYGFKQDPRSGYYDNGNLKLYNIRKTKFGNFVGENYFEGYKITYEFESLKDLLDAVVLNLLSAETRINARSKDEYEASLERYERYMKIKKELSIDDKER